MSKTELLLYMIGGSYIYTTGIFTFLWKELGRVRRVVTNHHRHELDDLRDRIDDLERGQRKDPE